MMPIQVGAPNIPLSDESERISWINVLVPILLISGVTILIFRNINYEKKSSIILPS